MRWDVAAGVQNKKLEDVAIKTLAGFANRVGGTLLIGVADDGAITGLERDYDCLGGNRDKMQLHLTNLVTNHFGQAYRAAPIRISFPEHDDAAVCRIDIDRSPSHVFVSTRDARNVSAERFFVRSGNSTQEHAARNRNLHPRTFRGMTIADRAVSPAVSRRSGGRSLHGGMRRISR
ncbi:helix-turn-helix domain-containing protein [Sphingomonas sp. SUN019]|uniref:AlbA family DNA-binding domain-containing protein n=1 Tax=Sphingomonas sp. SUN019 TaxID=2937788 RepID=UPI0038D3BC6E